MRSIDVFYASRMVSDSGGYSPSAAKAKEVVQDWRRHSLPIDIVSFAPTTRDEIGLAHDGDYVTGILDLTLANGHGNKLLTVAETLPWTVGSHYAASVRALEVGIACSPTSGFHHAGYQSSRAFCTFNGLMVSAVRLLRESRAHQIAIWDLDYHWPDGCEDIIERLALRDDVMMLSNSYSESSRVIFDEIDVHIEILDRFQPDIVMYQAGADMFIGDPLGGAMTIPELRRRDQMVFTWCQTNRVPVVWNLAGGYTREPDGSIPTILEIHRNTMQEAIECFVESGR